MSDGSGTLAARVPAVMRELDQWVTWKHEKRGKQWTKVPYRADGRTLAAVDQPKTWASLGQALAAPVDKVQGIGFVFTADDPLCGLDFDKCIDADGELHSAVAQALAALGGYQEASPSKTGMHAVVLGRLSGSRHSTAKTPWGGKFEVYDRLRFFTVTGQGSGEPKDAQAMVDRYVGMWLPPDSATFGADEQRTVDEVLAKWPQLGRIARHEPPAPQDESDSGWEHYLACEALRCELTYEEWTAIVKRFANHRQDPSKAIRADYLKKTWKAAQEAVDAQEKDPAARLNRRYNLRGEDRQFVRGDPIKDVAGGEGKVYLYTATGRCYRLGRIADLFEAPKHNRIVSQVTRSRFGLLSPTEAHAMTQAIIELCGGEDGDPLSEYWDWVLEFIARADAIIDLEPQDTTQRMEAARQFAKEERELASKKRFAIFRDVYTEELWLPAGALLECSGSKKTPRQFASDLAEIGWRHWPVDWRGRGGREAREQGEVDRFQRAFYIGLT